MIKHNVGEQVSEGADRRRFLQGAAMATAAGAAVTFGLGTSAPALAVGVGGRDTRGNFRDIQRHENAHVSFLLSALGPALGPSPR